MERLDGAKWSCIGLKQFGWEAQENANCENDRQDDQPRFEESRSRHWVGQNERRFSGIGTMSKFQSHQRRKRFILGGDVATVLQRLISAAVGRLSRKKQVAAPNS